MTGVFKGDNMKSDAEDPEILENSTSRESLLRANSRLIAQLQKRVSQKRFRVQEGDSIKLGYIRALTNALQVQNSILKDVEIDTLRHELEEVRELIEQQNLSQHSN